MENKTVPIEAEKSEKLETYSFTSRPALIQKIQELSNKIHNGNRSKTIVALLEKEFQG
jgi:hypothetical protein